ncbi:Galactokinase [hydrothermal vent metagenome]|uniref:Galactokinase n=1 Tax=hydrothermal vent metagenome TaxID=652676 RepID=A0A3B0VEJ3_9ZZZZ
MIDSNQSLFEQVQHIFRELTGRETAVTIRAPGRVNLLGSHLDYNEGWVLPGAIEPSVWLAAAPTTDNRVTVHALNFGETAAFQLPHLELFASSVGGNWINYPMGVAWALQKAGHPLVGMDVVLVSNLPIGAGVSSSAAVEMAFLLAWEALSGFQLDDLSRAKIGRKTENEYVGVNSGVMDQFACVASRANRLIFLNCRTMSHELLPMPSSIAVVLVDSGVRRQLAASNYNDRPAECREATAVLQQYLPQIKTLRDVSLDDLELFGHHLPQNLRRRAAHVVGECVRAQAGATALRQGDVATFGKLMRQSHISSRDNYENSTPELDFLAATAWATAGCYGARFGGGGYGGFMQILAEETAVPDLIESINSAFVGEYGRIPTNIVTKLVDGAKNLGR